MKQKNLEPDDSYTPPIGTPVFTPAKQVVQFFPCLTPEQHRWAEAYEKRALPFAQVMGQIFGVPVISDLQYQDIPELDKNTSLYVVQTRAGIPFAQQDVYEWFNLVVVVKYCVVLALKSRVTISKMEMVPLECMLWSTKNEEYVRVIDTSVGYITSGTTLLEVIEKWAVEEKLAAWIPQQGPQPVPTIHQEKRL
jgi:hypothetical protein